MNITYDFREVKVSEVRDFIEANHYSGSINGCKVSHCYALFDSGELVGAMLFGALSTTAWKRYSDIEGSVLELRRLVCLDYCPRNTESWFIAKAIKELKKLKQYEILVSYADPYHGHSGTIYQASNWTYLGTTNKDVLLKDPSGILYHSRALRTRYNGEFKPFAVRLQELDKMGLLTRVEVPGKHIYTYNLNGVHKVSGVPYPKETLVL